MQAAVFTVFTAWIAFGSGHQLPNGGKIWAVLVAGSNGFFNYRHQADICHAYQILHANGIPDENIIVMMYDDIAYSDENPRKGIIINEPNGDNVYDGVPIDYSGENVNSSIFLKVLTGKYEDVKDIGSGRVLESGPHDHVFVNFVDHGAPGLLSFPNDVLLASALEDALQQMIANKQFARMVFYVEACESGSMFDNLLPDTTNIFVTTAADPNESSYACYYDNTLLTYLGDVYSVNWMKDAETENLINETLHHQYEVVRTETNTSHVEEYGNLDIGSMHVADFMGWRDDKLIHVQPRHSIEDAVPSQYVPITILQRKLEAANNTEDRVKLKLEIHRQWKIHNSVRKSMKLIVKHLYQNDDSKVQELFQNKLSLTRNILHCYEKLVLHFFAVCHHFSENPYVFKHLYILVNICADGQLSESTMLSSMNCICQKSCF